MSKHKVYAYREKGGTSPVKAWLQNLPHKVYAKAAARIERLEEQGHQLRRPEADYLRDGIYELRWGFQNVNYRLLYFFHGREIIVLAHGLTKENRVPDRDIEQALKHKEAFETNPDLHSEEFSLEEE